MFSRCQSVQRRYEVPPASEEVGHAQEGERHARSLRDAIGVHMVEDIIDNIVSADDDGGE